MTQMKDTPEELIFMAKGLYATLVSLTNNPSDAAQVIMIMHLLLWMNGNSGDTSAEAMLKNYTSDFIHNLKLNGEQGMTVQ